MQNGEPKGRKEVDTLRVSLLGFSLISIIIISLSVFYIFLHSAANWEGFIPYTSDTSITLLNIFKRLLLTVLIFPQVISLAVWLLMPLFVKHRYNLEPLPPEHTCIYDCVKEIASEMGISPPKILYTDREVANCFNLGRTESESTIVISAWLVNHLDPDELKAVLIHEMAHTKNRDVTFMAYFSAVRRVFSLLPLLFLVSLVYIPLYYGFSPLWYLEAPEIMALFLVLFGCIAFVCILLIFGIQWFSRLREVAADARASLLIDKNILKRTLYKLACVRSFRMLFVSSCLMMSGGKGSGILSTHPSLYERYVYLNRERFIIDTGKSPSLRFCFTTALSMFLFTIFISYVVMLPFLLLLKPIYWNVGLVFFLPTLTAMLLFLYYPYLSMKYIGVIITWITAVGSVFYVGCLLFGYVGWVMFRPSPQDFPSTFIDFMDEIVPVDVDLVATLVFFVLQRIIFAVLTFLITGSLRYAKKVYKARHT